MEIKVPKFTNKGNNKRFKNRKPYWNDKLKELWNIMRGGENNFISYKGKKPVRSALRWEYTQERESFDKALNVPNGHLKNQSPTTCISRI